MTTLSELSALYLADLNGSTGSAWTDTQVKNWIKEAIQNLPLLRPTTHTFTAAADGQADYLLPVTAKTVTYVWHVREAREIPLGSGQILYGETGVYFHFLDRQDETALNELTLSDGAAALIETGDELTVQARSQHVYALADDDHITVPAQHQRVLRLAVDILAFQNRLNYHAGQLTMQEVDWLRQAINDRQLQYIQAIQGADTAAQSFTPFVVWSNPE